MDLELFLKNAAHVKPSKKQLRLMRETPFYAFIHFSPNTYTNLEWGKGTESPSIFNPTELDCNGWCEAIKSAGMKGVVLTAKHHDGFCLWQTDYTEHCMKNSPYKNGEGDIVRELSDACKKHGLKFGFYLSPWDRNSKLYGTDEYNTYYKNQLTELLTNYGEIFHVWFDGACGEGPNGIKQLYDWEGFFEIIHKYQPQATIFHDHGEIRWCGNESGETGYAQWSVVPKELCYFNKNVQTNGSILKGDLSEMYNTDIDIGSLSNIIYSEGLVFSPAEVDMSIRKGWFYHKDEEPRSAENLFETYINTVGGNTTFILSVPPMPNGQFDKRDVKALKELGQMIKRSFENEQTKDAVITQTELSGNQVEYIIRFQNERQLSFIEICENIAEGQRVESFKLFINNCGIWENIKMGTTIGNKRILRIDKNTSSLRLLITSARDKVDIESIKVF